MKNFDEYVHFVVGAKIAGCEIEYNDWGDVLLKAVLPQPDMLGVWDWYHNCYFIKLPEGWEYVIEDGEIAFREPKLGQYFLSEDFKSIVQNVSGDCNLGKRPIIKRIEDKTE